MIRVLLFTSFILISGVQNEGLVSIKSLSKVSSAFQFAEYVYKKMNHIPTDGERISQNLQHLTANLQEVKTINDKIFENSQLNLQAQEKSRYQYLLTEKMNFISTLMEKMQNKFNSYMDIKDLIEKYEDDSITRYMNSILRIDSKVIGILEDIHDQIVSRFAKTHNGDDSTILQLILSDLQDFPHMCNKKKSINMVIFDLYEVIRNTEVTGYTIVLFAYDFLKTHYPKLIDKHTFRKKLVDKIFVRIENEINAAFKDALGKSSRAIWTCNPKNEEYKTWVSLNDNIKGYGRIWLNIEPVKSDTEKSMVVTGARFQTRPFTDFDGLLAVEVFIEIQQGKLLNNGTIDATTLEWKNSLSVAHPRRMGFAPEYTEFSLWAQDFHNISDGGYPIVMTGLGLTPLLRDRFGLQVYGSPVLPLSHSPKIINKFIEADFVMPKYQVDESGLYIHVKDPLKMDSIPILGLHETLSSDRTTEPSNTIVRYNAHVTFTRSKNTNDKMIVPFLDLTEVVSDPPMPLSGAGLYYKTTKRYAGYISIELSTLSLEANIPNEVKLEHE